MYLAPDEEEQAVATAAAEFLAEVIPIERLHRPAGMDLSLNQLQSLASMDWFSMLVPEEAGGSGLSAVEHALFFREVGRQCGPVEILAQALAALMLAENDLSKGISNGQDKVCLAVRDAQVGFRLLGSTDARYALLGEPQTAALIPLTDHPSTACAPLDPATSMRVCPTLPEPVATAPGGLFFGLGQLGVAAMLVGCAETALALIVEYAKVRETFGKKIGSYQAVRHPCANMALHVESARAQLWFAATALKERHPDAGTHLHTAKHLANEAALHNADTNIQLHGGIGVTDEHDAHLLLKHALLLERLFGDKRRLLKQLLHAKLEA